MGDAYVIVFLNAEVGSKHRSTSALTVFQGDPGLCSYSISPGGGGHVYAKLHDEQDWQCPACINSRKSTAIFVV